MDITIDSFVFVYCSHFFSFFFGWLHWDDILLPILVIGWSRLKFPEKNKRHNNKSLSLMWWKGTVLHQSIHLMQLTIHFAKSIFVPWRKIGPSQIEHNWYTWHLKNIFALLNNIFVLAFFYFKVSRKKLAKLDRCNIHVQVGILGKVGLNSQL